MTRIYDHINESLSWTARHKNAMNCVCETVIHILDMKEFITVIHLSVYPNIKELTYFTNIAQCEDLSHTRRATEDVKVIKGWKGSDSHK